MRESNECDRPGAADLRVATASANANIALVKYWGKADEKLIIPCASSLSLTLDGLTSTTTVEFFEDVDQAGRTERACLENGSGRSSCADSLTIDGLPQSGKSLDRVSCFLDIVRQRSGVHLPAHVTSRNTVPFGAGLASSASAFAALAAAASKAAGMDLSPRDLSRLARRGSGSACRSVFGGLVQWHAGHDDETSYAEPVDMGSLDLAVIVVLVSSGLKPVSSREAMSRTVATSPLYPAWIRSCASDLDEALGAISRGDLERLGEVTEANALGMHAAMMASRPAVFYWLPDTVAVLRAVGDIRDAGLGAWSTMDAGPNVKVLVDARDAEAVAAALRERVPQCELGIHRPGSGVRFE
jgi:diphosphomevalonate decarboxylase